MNKISNLIVFMLLHGLVMLSPPTSAMHMVQASDTADQQAALETTSSRNWNLPRKLKVAYPPENMRGNDKYYTAEKLKGMKVLCPLLSLILQVNHQNF
jgi:hypothetical protein